MDTITMDLPCTATEQKGHGVMAKRPVQVSPELIHSIPLFSSLSDESCTELATAATLRQLAARTHLFTEGGIPDALYIVLHGSAELFSEHDERHCTLAVAAAIKPLAPYAILLKRYPLSARVLDPSEMIVISAELIEELARRDLQFANVLIRELASECQELVEDFKNQRMRSTIERVAHWMLRGDSKSGNTGRIVIPFDKRVLASYLGMAPEHLSRSFATLASSGVAVQGRSVTLSDRGALSEIAREDVPERFLQRPSLKNRP
jgi:CRP/FNR family transcriptional activator FtrB